MEYLGTSCALTWDSDAGSIDLLNELRKTTITPTQQFVTWYVGNSSLQKKALTLSNLSVSASILLQDDRPDIVPALAIGAMGTLTAVLTAGTAGTVDQTTIIMPAIVTGATQSIPYGGVVELSAAWENRGGWIEVETQTMPSVYAPYDAQYVTMATDPILNNERVLQAGTGLSKADGGAGGNVTLSLKNTAVTPGSYGGSTHVGTFTVDQQGRLTAAGSVDISMNLSAVSGILPVENGGTGLDSGTSGGILYFAATDDIESSDLLTENAVLLAGGDGPPMIVSGLGDAGQVLTSNGDNDPPTWQPIGKGFVQLIGLGNIFLTGPATEKAESGAGFYGSSTPGEVIAPLRFDAGTIEYWDFLSVLTNYNGGGLTFTLPWLSDAGTSGVCRWGLAVRRMNQGENFATAHTYDFNDMDGTAQATAGAISTTAVTFTDGADMDSWASGEMAIVRVRRNATHENDTLVGDSVLLGFFGIET
jgi:hypothetical protein